MRRPLHQGRLGSRHRSRHENHRLGEEVKGRSRVRWTAARGRRARQVLQTSVTHSKGTRRGASGQGAPARGPTVPVEHPRVASWLPRAVSSAERVQVTVPVSDLRGGQGTALVPVSDPRGGQGTAPSRAAAARAAAPAALGIPSRVINNFGDRRKAGRTLARHTHSPKRCRSLPGFRRTLLTPEAFPRLGTPLLPAARPVWGQRGGQS